MSLTFCKTCGVVIQYADQCAECDEATDTEFADWCLDAARDSAWDDSTKGELYATVSKG